MPLKVPRKNSQMKHAPQRVLFSHLSEAEPQVSPVQHHIKTLGGTKQVEKVFFGSKKKKSFKESVCKEAFPKYLKNAAILQYLLQASHTWQFGQTSQTLTSVTATQF